MTDGADLAWLGLERQGDGRWSFELTSSLARHDQKLFGGTGIAAMTAAMEAETGRDALWATVQYAASADVGERLDVQVEVLAGGRRTSQVRMTATVGERIVLAGLGASGVPGTGALSAQFGTMPVVPGPDVAPEWGSSFRSRMPPGDRAASWFAIADVREVSTPDEAMLLWARMRDLPQSRATLGFLADMVPAAVVRAAGRVGGGTSLDNAIRFGAAPAPGTEWVLLDFDPYLAEGAYVHGAARIWSPDGTLLGVASQTAAAMLFE